jgi:hypothetical protein
MRTMTDDSTSASPPGRVRHLSSVYVFGGLTYGLGSFRVESPLDGSNSIVVWRACRLDRALEGGRGGRREEVRNDGSTRGLRWETIVPRW